jgi:hypothetical protein
VILVPLFACTALAAQTAAPSVPLEEPPAPQEGRKNQRVDRIHVEDTGVVIEEIRYGGQTQSIKVKPKSNMPAYEFQPTDLARSRPADSREGLGAATSQRVWNIFDF